jgi:5-deoxy-D-glucuronate isomerase
MNSPRLVTIPGRIDDRGALGFVEAGNHVPFDIRRIFFLYDLKPGKTRGAHAHKTLEQCIVSMAGAFEVRLDGGSEKTHFKLNSRDQALYIPPMHWTELDCFTPDAVCVVLASAHYDEADYIRNYSEFQDAIRTNGVGRV